MLRLFNQVKILWELLENEPISNFLSGPNTEHFQLKWLCITLGLKEKKNASHRVNSEPTSKISLFAFGDVASRKTLMATGIFTSSPSGTHRPCINTGVLFLQAVIAC